MWCGSYKITIRTHPELEVSEFPDFRGEASYGSFQCTNGNCRTPGVSDCKPRVLRNAFPVLGTLFLNRTRGREIDSPLLFIEEKPQSDARLNHGRLIRVFISFLLTHRILRDDELGKVTIVTRHNRANRQSEVRKLSQRIAWRASPSPSIVESHTHVRSVFLRGLTALFFLTKLETKQTCRFNSTFLCSSSRQSRSKSI